jgi:hypothetical protein
MSNLNINGALKCNGQIFYSNATYLSSLNVNGFISLNYNVTLLSSLNMSGFTTSNNNVTIVSSLNISGLSTLSNITTLLSSLNVSGFTTLSNNVTMVSSINISGLSTLSNITTLASSLNVSGFATLKNNSTLNNRYRFFIFHKFGRFIHKVTFSSITQILISEGILVDRNAWRNSHSHVTGTLLNSDFPF